MQGGSSGGAAAVKDVSVNVTNDMLIEAMLLFHSKSSIWEGEQACARKFPQYGSIYLSKPKNQRSFVVQKYFPKLFSKWWNELASTMIIQLLAQVR